MQFFIWPRTKFTPAKRLLPIILIHTVFCRAVESGTDFTPKLISNPEIREKVQSTGYGITAVTPTKVRNKLGGKGGKKRKRKKEKKKTLKDGCCQFPPMLRNPENVPPPRMAVLNHCSLFFNRISPTPPLPIKNKIILKIIQFNQNQKYTFLMTTNIFIYSRAIMKPLPHHPFSLLPRT